MSRLTLLNGRFAICRLDAGSDVPRWAVGGAFSSVTRTDDELSIVCEEARLPSGLAAERGWRCLRVAGPLAFSEIGVLSSLTGALAEAQVSVFAISTYDTDYLLVREADADPAVVALRSAGHEVSD